MSIDYFSIRQFVPSDYCLWCKGCCRFRQKYSEWSPAYIIPEDGGDNYICPHLSVEDNECKIYSTRPFDCRLYPFMLVRLEGAVFLGLDRNCPYISQVGRKESGQDKINIYADYLARLITQDGYKGLLRNNPVFISKYNQGADIKPLIYLKELDSVPEATKWNRLELEDKTIIDRYLKFSYHKLSSYSFASIYIWRSHFDFFWKIVDANILMLAHNQSGAFLYLSPAGKEITQRTLDEGLKILEEYNGESSSVSRIENIEIEDRQWYEVTNLKSDLKEIEYVYSRDDLVLLRGRGYKTKRWACNFFKKHYPFELLDFEPDMKDECISLYKQWEQTRKDKFSDDFYRYLMADACPAQKTAMENYEQLGLKGKVVRLGGRIKGYTLGFGLNPDTFCILFETTDLSVKGLSQFIFREFCRELKDYKWINIMSDSGLENLRQVKLSYRPWEKVSSFTVRLN